MTVGNVRAQSIGQIDRGLPLTGHLSGYRKSTVIDLCVHPSRGSPGHRAGRLYATNIPLGVNLSASASFPTQKAFMSFST